MSPSLDVQCKALRGGESQSWESLAPNPDISGIGVRSLPNAQIAKTLIFQVLIGFLTTAWVTLLLVTVYFLMGCVEKKLLNEIDRMVLTKISPRKRVRSVQHLELTLRRIVLMFSDQQVVTGIALLAGGYAQLSSGIDSYHRQMLVYLAWFSSLTHLTTLTVLRQYFQENHNARLWRSVLMLITVILLGAALLPTGDILWLEADQSVTILAPALCYFRRLGSRIFDDRFEVSSRTGVSMAISLVVLISGYITRIAKLSVKAGSSTRHYLRHIPSRSIRTIRGVVLKRLNEPAPGFRKIHWIVAYIALETSYIWVKAFFDVYESMVDYMARIGPSLGD
ncbi:MAG: hypothetical protein L6R38_008522 [Xanthoria sp. 2 TBL-2021]|nr:MAG: hypothetical protein L6R38_008522 [Xanthoria sp. 2 TBL-2021]